MNMSRADFWFVLTRHVKSRKCRSLTSYLSGSRQHGFLRDVFSIGLLKACQIGNCHQQESLSFSTGSNICLLFYLSQYLSSFLLDCDLLILEIHPAVELHRPHMNIVSLHLCPPYQLKVCIDESIVSCLQQRRDLPCLLGKFSVFVQMQSQSHTPVQLDLTISLQNLEPFRGYTLIVQNADCSNEGCIPGSCEDRHSGGFLGFLPS